MQPSLPHLRGHSFFNVNEELLERYSRCHTAAEVIVAQNEWLEQGGETRVRLPPACHRNGGDSDGGESGSGGSEAGEGEQEEEFDQDDYNRWGACLTDRLVVG